MAREAVMNVPPRPEPQAPPPGCHPIVTALLIALGIILLLPGACALLHAGSLFLTDTASMINDIIGGEPTMRIALVVWAVCLLISGLGIWLLRRVQQSRRA
jgi:hypothetical protein